MTENLTPLFDEIESERFAAKLTVASGFRTFEKGCYRQPELTRLCAALAGDAGRKTLAGRITNLLARSFDPRYRNPWDAAIASYLLVLQAVDPIVARTSARELIAGSHRGLWWAGMAAERIQSVSTAAVPPPLSSAAFGDPAATPERR